MVLSDGDGEFTPGARLYVHLETNSVVRLPPTLRDSPAPSTPTHSRRLTLDARPVATRTSPRFQARAVSPSRERT